ncbi:MAG: aminodeoxychorismate synthase component I [Thermoanaerobaculia bacterium]
MKGALRRAILRHPAAGAPDGVWWLFEDPVESFVAATAEEVPDLLARVERATESGLWSVGCVDYEAAPAFDPALRVRPRPVDSREPFASFSLFTAPQSREPVTMWQPAKLRDLRACLGVEEHAAAVAAIHAAIAAGETYQVNFTFVLEAGFDGDPEALFWRLAPASGAPHAAFLDLGESALVSLSPELFFERRGDLIVMRPMKGTRPRGRYLEEDERLASELVNSPKERAENLMIVDMIRNDLGKLAETGTVAVEKLLEAERYPTVWQMTSTIAAQTRASLPELFRALFPCASVTGAPKARTMDWITRLESRPRGIYCGAIGWVAPGGLSCFSVAIRTAVVDCERGKLEYGVGSGVVWESQASAEYQECLTKGRALEAQPRTFSLFETMLWRPGCGVHLLDGHLSRLVTSAKFFGFQLDELALREIVTAELETLQWKETSRQRLRLELASDGRVTLTRKHFPSERRHWTVLLASRPVASQDTALFHKTTHREIYDAALEEARAAECDEAILWNERGELTEGTRTNLILEMGGERLTPARDSGLLAGVFRQSLLDRRKVREAVLQKSDLVRADRILLVNALRGWIPATLRSARWRAP